MTNRTWLFIVLLGLFIVAGFVFVLKIHRQSSQAQLTITPGQQVGIIGRVQRNKDQSFSLQSRDSDEVFGIANSDRPKIEEALAAVRGKDVTIEGIFLSPRPNSLTIFQINNTQLIDPLTIEPPAATAPASYRYKALNFAGKTCVSKKLGAPVVAALTDDKVATLLTKDQEQALTDCIQQNPQENKQ